MDNNNNSNNSDRLTSDNVPQQTAQAPIQASPFGQATPAEQVQPTAPVAPVAPVQPSVEQQPAQTQPAAPIQPVAPQQQQPQTPAFTGLNTSQTMSGGANASTMQPSPAAPTTGSFIPQSMNPARVQRQETYLEDMEQKAHHMRDVLHSQPKVWAMVPLQPGEKPGTMLPVGINGYFIYIKKGVMVQVPEQVGTMLAESFNLDYENGSDIDLSKNEDKQRALA